jgi:hypothetical protein
MAKKGEKMGILNKIKGVWSNRKALTERARLRALHVAETALAIASDSQEIARKVLDAMLFVESFFPKALGSEKAKRVLGLLKQADSTLSGVEPYLQKAIDWAHEELNKDGKAGWG